MHIQPANALLRRLLNFYLREAVQERLLHGCLAWILEGQAHSGRPEGRGRARESTIFKSEPVHGLGLCLLAAPHRLPGLKTR